MHLHETFGAEVEALLNWMLILYPWVDFQGLEVFEPESQDDHSLAYATGCGYHNKADDCKIYLNGYWFSRPSWFLRSAGVGNSMVATRAPEVAAWHGGMHEPYHTIVHEFGHLVAFSAGNRAQGLARQMFQDALLDPKKAPTGYSLANQNEWFAETFAVAHSDSILGRRNPQVQKMQRWLRAL